MVDNDFEIGEILYLKTDEEQKIRILNAILVTPNGYLYRLASGSSDSYHYPMEITREKSFMLEKGSEIEQ
jgi:hypothetical protein